MDIDLQKAELQDLQRLLPFVAAFHECGSISSTADERHRSLKILLSRPEFGGVWFVQKNEQPIGYVALCLGFSIEFGGFDAFVDELFILPDCRNKGYGHRALELVKAEAAQLNIRALHLEVAKVNLAAQKLYSKANFAMREKYVLMTSYL